MKEASLTEGVEGCCTEFMSSWQFLYFSSFSELNSGLTINMFCPKCFCMWMSTAEHTPFRKVDMLIQWQKIDKVQDSIPEG